MTDLLGRLLVPAMKPLFAMLVPALAGFLTTALVSAWKRASPLFDSMNATTKRVVVVLVASALTMLANLVGVTIMPDTLVSPDLVLDAAGLEAIIGAVLAFVLHAGTQASASAKAIDRASRQPNSPFALPERRQPVQTPVEGGQ
jgi:hypothetical protein